MLWKEICHFYKFYRTTYVPLYKRTIGPTKLKYKCFFRTFFGLEWTVHYFLAALYFHLETFTTPSLENLCLSVICEDDLWF